MTATAAAAAAAATSAAVAAAAAAAATGGGSHPMKDAKAAAVKGEDSMCMGFRPCKADLAAKSEAELRRKGTNFLRHHASKHGIINSSRKRLDFVIKELSQHYLNVHKFALIPEPEGAAAAAAAATVGSATSTSANAAGGKTGKVKSASGGSALAADDKNGHVKQEPNDQQQNDVKLSQSGAQSGGHHANNAAFMLSSQLQDYQSYFQPGAHFLQSLGMAPPNNFPYQNPAIGLQPHQVQLPVHPTLPTPPQTTHTNGFILPGPAPSSGGGGGGGGGVNGGSGATAASSSSSSSLTQSLAAQDFQTRILNANSQNCQKKSKPVAKQQHDSKHHHHHHSRDSSGGGGGSSKPHFCVSPIVAKNKAGLTALGTSKLRPQASAHKVFNSSRRPKKEVVEELWAHYEDYHADEIAKMNSGAVGGSGSSLTEALMEQASSYHQHHHQQQQQQQHHHHGGHPHHASSTAHASSTGGGLAAAVGGSTATTSSSAASAAAAAAAAQRAFASAQVAIAPLLAANSGFNPGWVGHVAGDEDENSSQISNNSAWCASFEFSDTLLNQ